MTLTPTQRNFGALGDLLVVVLFVYIASTIEGSRVVTGLGLGLTLSAVRLVTKVLGVAVLARASGLSCRKGCSH